MARSGVPLINVVIGNANPDSAGRLRGLLQTDPTIQVLGMAAERSQVLPLLNLDPDIFLLAEDMELHETTTLVRQLLELAPNVQVLLITEDMDPADMRRAVLAGARGILHWPVGSEELLSTVHE